METGVFDAQGNNRHNRKSAKRIVEYIQNQRKEESVSDQITMKEYTDLFAGIK